jgi:hypothetical protein
MKTKVKAPGAGMNRPMRGYGKKESACVVTNGVSPSDALGTVPNLRNLYGEISVILGTVPEKKAHVIESREAAGLPTRITRSA